MASQSYDRTNNPSNRSISNRRQTYHPSSNQSRQRDELPESRRSLPNTSHHRNTSVQSSLDNFFDKRFIEDQATLYKPDASNNPISDSDKPKERKKSLLAVKLQNSETKQKSSSKNSVKNLETRQECAAWITEICHGLFFEFHQRTPDDVQSCNGTATALLFMHRYFDYNQAIDEYHGVDNYDIEDLVVACVYLASKVNEFQIPLRYVIMDVFKLSHCRELQIEFKTSNNKTIH